MTTPDLGRVLIVDDEIKLMTALCDMLTMQGYEAVGHTSPQEALQALRVQNFDVLLSDLMMPEMDGITLLQTALTLDPYLMGIIMTGQGTVQTAVEAMRVGAFDYLLKPFKFEALASVLTRAQKMRQLRMENVQLRETVAIYELGQAMAHTFDKQMILRKIVQGAMQQVNGDEASVMLPSPDGKTLYIAAIEGEGREHLLGHRVPLVRSISGWVASHHEPLLWDGAVHDPRFQLVKPRDNISSMSLPMLIRGKLVGVMNVNATHRRPFTLGQVKALTIFANLAAASLENAVLYTQLEQAEEKYRSIVEHAITGIFQTTSEGRFLTANPALAGMLGYASVEALMEGIPDIGSQLYVDASQRTDFMRHLAQHGTVLNYEAQFSRQDGRVIWVSISARGVHDPRGALRYYEGTVEDITARKQAETRVQRQLARLALLHQITCAIGERQDLYSIFQVVLRYLEQELPLAFAGFCLGATGSDTVTVTAMGPVSQTLAPTVGLEERVVVSLDQLGLRPCVAGQTVSVFDTAQEAMPLWQRFAQAGLRSLIATPLLVEDSIFGLLLAARREPQGFSSGEGEFLRQLSEHVALAAHHASLYAKLQQAYDDLHQSQQAVMQQERLRVLGQMASGIAHDINNAISPITLYVESLLASDTTLSARARDYLSTVQQAAQDVAHTVARLREFYRQPGGPQDARPVDLNQIVPQVVEVTRAKWRDEPQHLGVTITVHTALQEEGLPPILGVESELREALINLVFNAVDAMPRGGILTLQTRATPTAVVVEVSDTGIGMDETTRQRCLEPFYTTKDERGTGLGLAMVYGVSERHAAQLIIESAVGQGTTMRLLFPIALSQGALDVQPADVEASPHPLRILVVDDDLLIRRLLQDVLQTEGHVVTVVEGGRVGLEALHGARERQEPFDVVITDLGMPEMDGREVARGVKCAAPDTPVVLLTGWGQALQQDKSLPPHVDHLLSKPPRLQELRTVLRTVARPAGRKDNNGNN